VHCDRARENSKTAIKLGARGYIIKPFQAPKVIEEIKKVIGE
jgi:two-component system chemotaxis response regulator CheY